MSFNEHDLSGASWRKSTYSAQGNDTCVELAPVAGLVAIRDSKNPEIPPIGLTRERFRHLVNALS